MQRIWGYFPGVLRAYARESRGQDGRLEYFAFDEKVGGVTVQK